MGKETEDVVKDEKVEYAMAVAAGTASGEIDLGMHAVFGRMARLTAIATSFTSWCHIIHYKVYLGDAHRVWSDGQISCARHSIRHICEHLNGDSFLLDGRVFGGKREL